MEHKKQILNDLIRQGDERMKEQKGYLQKLFGITGIVSQDILGEEEKKQSKSFNQPTQEDLIMSGCQDKKTENQERMEKVMNNVNSTNEDCKEEEIKKLDILDMALSQGIKVEFNKKMKNSDYILDMCLNEKNAYLNYKKNNFLKNKEKEYKEIIECINRSLEYK